MKVIQPKLLKHQSAKYFDAFFSKKQTNIISKIFFRIVRRYIAEEKNNQSYDFDYLICGVNPIYNSLLLLNILKKATYNISVGIYINETMQDYYPYDVILKEMNFNIDQTLEEIYKIAKEKNINIINLNDNVLFPYECKKEDGFFLMRLFVPNRSIKSSANQYVEYNNKLKNELQKKYNKIINQLSKKIKWNISNITNDTLPVLFTRNLYLTSIPQGWLEIKNEKLKCDLREKLILNHDFVENSFGSAKEINLGLEPRLIKESIEKDFFNLLNLKD